MQVNGQNGFFLSFVFSSYSSDGKVVWLFHSGFTLAQKSNWAVH